MLLLHLLLRQLFVSKAFRLLPRSKTRRFPPLTLFSSHERQLPLSLCTLDESERQKKYRYVGKKGIVFFFFPALDGERKKERKKHALSQLRHRSPAHSPQRSQLSCATGKIQRRPPGLAREQERGGHLGRWCGEKRNKRKNKLLWPMVFFLLLLLFSFSHNFFLSFFFACCLLSGKAEERDQRINTNDGGTRARAQRCV